MVFKAKILEKTATKRLIEISLNDKTIRKIKHQIPKKFIKEISNTHLDIHELFIFGTLEKLKDFENKRKIFTILLNSAIDPKTLNKKDKDKCLELKSKKVTQFEKMFGI